MSLARFEAATRRTSRRELFVGDPARRPHGAAMASGFLGSVRQALRMLAKNPAFTSLAVYVPFRRNYLSNLHRADRTRGDAAVLPAIREATHGLNPYPPIVFAQPMRQYAGITLFPQRIAAWVAGDFASLGWLLTGIGIDGVTAFSVEQRAMEIDVRTVLRGCE